jgi:AcrR family transcriptional regulator
MLMPSSAARDTYEDTTVADVPTSIREQLLDAAHAVLRDKGIMGATTREIARAAKVADGTLYNHFRTREELFLALFERVLPAIKDRLGELPLKVGTDDVASILEGVLVGAVEFFREAVPLFSAVFTDPDLLAGYRAKLSAQNRGPHRAFGPIEKYLAAEQRLHRVPASVDAAALSQQLVAIAFFRAFTERFLDTPASPAADRRWAAQQIATWQL